jgi:hypothetical protein
MFFVNVYSWCLIKSARKKQHMIKIKQKKLKNLKSWFAKYVRTFINGDEECEQNITLKSDHTKRVCEEIRRLGDSLALNSHELRLAEIIALFHDLGRFEQYARYRTFVDQQSEDHADLGVNVLKKNNVLSELDDSTQDLIFRTIRYHNRSALPKNETKSCLFFAKLLRDADKLDIWRVVIDYYYRENEKRNGAIELGLPDTEGISEPVYQDIMNERIVDANHIKNLNDFKVLQMGWVFDINFKQTLKAVKSRNYLEMIRDVLPKSDQIQKIFERTYSHLIALNDT